MAVKEHCSPTQTGSREGGCRGRKGNDGGRRGNGGRGDFTRTLMIKDDVKKLHNINQNDFLTLPTTLGAPTPTSRSSSPSELVYSPTYVELLFEFIFYSFVLCSAESILHSLFFPHFNFFPLLNPHHLTHFLFSLTTKICDLTLNKSRDSVLRVFPRFLEHPPQPPPRGNFPFAN